MSFLTKYQNFIRWTIVQKLKGLNPTFFGSDDVQDYGKAIQKTNILISYTNSRYEYPAEYSKGEYDEYSELFKDVAYEIAYFDILILHKCLTGSQESIEIKDALQRVLYGARPQVSPSTLSSVQIESFNFIDLLNGVWQHNLRVYSKFPVDLLEADIDWDLGDINYPYSLVIQLWLDNRPITDAPIFISEVKLS